MRLRISMLCALLASSSALATTVVEPLTRMTNTPYNNVQETTIVGHTNASGVEVTTSAYMLYANSSELSPTYVKTVTRAGGTTYSSAVVPTLESVGDPVLAVNPFAGAGVPGPRRTYLAAVEWGTATSTRGMLNVWYSDDGGQTNWWRPGSVGTSSYWKYFDKPSIVVSEYSGTRGWVYVSAMTPRVSTTTPAKIRVYLSANGGSSFSEIGGIPYDATTTSLQSPILRVDPTTGFVFLFWVDWTKNQHQIRVASLTAFNGSFVERQPLSLPALLTPLADDNDRLCSNDNLYCVKADSMFSVRYNPVSATFGVVWHEREPGTGANRTDVKFAYYVPTTPWSSGNFWGPIRPVNRVTTGDQWHPALACDPSGNYLVTYYDRRDNESYNFWYRMYGTKLDPWGGWAEAQDTPISTSSSNPANLRLYVDPQGVSSYTMGEYQEVWFWNGHWTLSYIYAPSAATDNVYFSTVNP